MMLKYRTDTPFPLQPKLDLSTTILNLETDLNCINILSICNAL